jgi:hypothetical protein
VEGWPAVLKGAGVRAGLRVDVEGTWVVRAVLLTLFPGRLELCSKCSSSSSRILRFPILNQVYRRKECSIQKLMRSFHNN